MRPASLLPRRALPLTIYAAPVAKPRPRVDVRQRKDGRKPYPHFRQPATAVKAEWQIRQAWLEHYESEPVILKPRPVALTIRVYRELPLDIPKSRIATALPTQRPDLDNYEKTVMDALTGVAYEDDRQVVEKHSWKLYAVDGRPRWEIVLEEL